MRRFLSVSVLCLGGWAALIAQEARNVAPLPRAHAHNDYEHARPLLDALQHGFCSVEADVHLVHGALLVAHDRDKVRPARTLEKLYLDPLRERVSKNGGRVYPDGPLFTLLIDIKSAAEPTYHALKRVLARYADMLTRYQREEIIEGAVSVILSGNRPFKLMAHPPDRLAALDGRLADLNSGRYPAALVPLISDNWKRHFAWRGQGKIGEADLRRLSQWVAQAHAQGRRIRFWAAPDRIEYWRLAYRAGVDLINTDRLDGVASFLNSMARPESKNR